MANVDPLRSYRSVSLLMPSEVAGCGNSIDCNFNMKLKIDVIVKCKIEVVALVRSTVVVVDAT